ncbi:MAG: PadR family transcriptional regulator [Gordonia sp. (in: high G+C Gram-positive bacteria)]
MGGQCSEQVPLGPVPLLVLGLLAERPMHPYEMFQLTVERKEDRLAKFRPGTMYHAVGRLAAAGLIEVHEVQRAGNRPERTVYAITPAGRQMCVDSIAAILRRHPTEYPELYLALSEAHGLPRTLVIDLVESRLVEMRRSHDELVAAHAAARTRGVPEMFYLDVGCRIVTLAAQIGWLAEFVERLRAGTLAWLDDPGSPYRTGAPASDDPPDNPETSAPAAKVNT